MIYLCPRHYHQKSERLHYGEVRRLQRGGLPVSLPPIYIGGLVSVALTVIELSSIPDLAIGTLHSAVRTFLP